MKEIKITYYQCETCGEKYKERATALTCESRPVSQDNAEVGDKVRILNGDGKGEVAIVTKKTIVSKDWGHYQWKKYWHTVMLDAKLSSGFHRMLLYDGYENAD